MSSPIQAVLIAINCMSILLKLMQKALKSAYIAWPRGEQFMPTMQAIWCSEDRKAAFDQAAQGLPVASAECKNPVRDQYQLGLNMV